MSELKFRYAAKISANYLTDKRLSVGESIYLAAKNCKIELNSNYNLGIIILCAPIIKVVMNKPSCLKNSLKVFLKSISKTDGQLILESIKFVKPAGISNYKGKFVYDKSKPNGTMRKLIDSSKIFKLNWKPKISLKSGIKLIVKELI